jgi:hypothetical protein
METRSGWLTIKYRGYAARPVREDRLLHMIWRWLRVATLGAALMLTGAPTLERVNLGAGRLEITTRLQQAEAQSRSRSSGGYSRPSGGMSRTPSFGSGVSRSRTPSASGGYARPSSPGGSSFNYGSRSSGDRFMSRRSGGDAFGRYRAQQEQQRQPPIATPAPSAPSSPGYTPGYDYGGSRRTGGYGWGHGSGAGNRGYADRGYAGGASAAGVAAGDGAYRPTPPAQHPASGSGMACSCGSCWTT